MFKNPKSNFHLIAHLIFSGVLAMACFQNSTAQVTPPPTNENNEQKIEEKIERVAEQGDDNTDYEELRQVLDDLKKHPININNATREQLETLPFLDAVLINNMLVYIQTNGQLIALEELQSIAGFDEETILQILPYITVNSNADDLHLTPSQYLKAGKSTLLIRSGSNLNQQEGYTIEDTSLSHYAGSPWALYVRYRFSYSPKYSIGITAEKDPGEEFFKGSQKQGFDYYSAHLFIRDIGIIKKIAIGDYQLEYGQGVSVWTGLAFGKSPDVTTIKRNARGIVPYTSVNEESFKRGAAISLGIKNISLDIYYSHRRVDGNAVAQDSLNAEFIVSSLQTSGLHRTQSEIADKNSITVNSAGSHLQFNKRNFEVGLTASYNQLDKPLERTTALYNQFQFNGDQFFNLSADYSWLIRNVSLFGEVTRSDNNSYSFVQGAIVSLDPKFAVSLFYRNFQRSFYGLESNPVRESNPFNEKGFLTGLNIKPVKSISISGYADLFSFPWLRYQVNSPSHGSEYLAQLTFTPNKKTEIYLRFKQTSKQDNTTNTVPIEYLVDYTQNNLRFNISYKISNSVSMRSRIETTKIIREDKSENNGYAIIQDVFFKPMGSDFTLNLRYALFDTKDYDSRIYTYENDVYGVFSIPSYYDTGMRIYLNVRYQVIKDLDVYVRFAQSVYSNKTTVGSGLDEIQGNKKSDLRFALKWDF